MTDVFIIADNIFSPLGVSSAENFTQLKSSASGVKRHDDTTMSEQAFYASLFDKQNSFLKDESKNRYTKFEKLLIASITDALKGSSILPEDKKTVLVIGGSLGARTINESIYAGLQKFKNNNIQLIWQTGVAFGPKAKESICSLNTNGIITFEFIQRMD